MAWPIDADDQVVLLLSYEGGFRATSGSASGLESTDIGAFEPGNTAVGQSLQLAGQGNYFTTLSERGAKMLAKLDRQRQKLIAALSASDADVVGLTELQNNGSVAIGDLVGRLNVALGGSTYMALADPAFTGEDAVKADLIFKPGA